jgi:hypothetical protein
MAQQRFNNGIQGYGQERNPKSWRFIDRLQNQLRKIDMMLMDINDKEFMTPYQ